LSLIFILDSLTVGNAYIRGILPVMGMKKNNIDAKYIVASDFNPRSVEINDVVVFVKYDRLGQAKEVKNKGAKVVLDIVDSKTIHKSEDLRQSIDALIVNTASSRRIIKSNFNFNKPIFKIPHIITNFNKDLKTQVRKSLPKIPKTLGYLGVRETFTDIDYFNSFCTKNDLNWYNAQPSITDNESHTLNIDLGCINFTGDKERIGGTLTITKPSAKLLNLFSYGIPTLFSPYESYIDAITSYGFNDLLWCCCSTKEAMFDKIDILMKDHDLYRELSDQAFDLSRNYHISNTSNIYKELIDYIGS